MAEIRWDTKQLELFAKSLRHDRDGRQLKLRMESQFDSITADLRDRLYRGASELPGVGSYGRELAESLVFKTKFIGGKKARVSIVGMGKTPAGRPRHTGALFDQGYLFHPAWGHWRSLPLPGYLRQDVPEGPQVVTDALSQSEPGIRADILDVLNDYLDRLTEMRQA